MNKNIKMHYDWIIGSDAKWTEETKDVLGYAPEDVSGQWFEIIHRDDYPDFEKKLRESLNSKKQFVHVYRVRKKGGKFILVKDVGDVVLNGNNEVAGMKGWVMKV